MLLSSKWISRGWSKEDELGDLPEALLSGERDEEPPKPQRRSSSYKLPLVCIICILFSNVIIYLVMHKALEEAKRCLLPLEFEGAAGAIEYQTVVLQPSGFGDDGASMTPFEGPPSPEIDALWHNLSSVGIYEITSEENSRLLWPTDETPGTDGQYYIQIEVFHQLHCLNFLRQQIYHVLDHDFPESHDKHVRHCIDYLRQVLMCHGDVHPITMYRKQGIHRNFWPNFTIPHTCRNWDRLTDWAAKRNTTGYTIES
ncbi:hypothetical protein ETB97_011454 [Aspergillus alliaceus]|uniref:Cyclochlorotine biosynthesis protein O n=1 Tax=Petromyces alliaceus TaxID=209559 RepID=A0A8H6AGA4_PETAA|nr:hypothetical protein ETB97_011454 [Aspergillus burnettii]